MVGREAILAGLRRYFSAPVNISLRAAIIDGGDIVIDNGTLFRDDTASGRYVVACRREPDESLKLAVDVPLP
jgi:hypothetical protein